MAGSRTKGEKRRAKRGRPVLEVEHREPNGRANRSSAKAVQRREDVARPALDARARALGIYIPVPKQMPGETMDEYTARRNSRDSAMRAADPLLKRGWAGCSVGQAIADQDDVEVLWDAVCLIRSRRAAYLEANDAPPEQAKGMNFPIKPDPGGTTAVVNSSAEPLTPEEFAQVADERWEELRDVIFAVHPLAVRFAVDRICAEVTGARENAVPRKPLLEILRAVVAGFALDKGRDGQGS